MATLPHEPLVLNWEALDVIPLELVDPFADDDDPGLDDGLAAPSGPRAPFATWLADQASYYRSLGHPAADFLADVIAGTADMARSLRASSPAEYEARLEVLDDDFNEWADAFAAGYDACVRDYHLPTF